jgi:hypothetical protein
MRNVREFINAVLVCTMALGLVCFLKYGDIEFIYIALGCGSVFALSIKLTPKPAPQVDVKWMEVKLQAVRHGDEFFIKNLETGTMRPSSRDEVSELWNKGQITIK